MTAPLQPHSLERFDQPQQVRPDPAILEANLAALRARQPQLAAALADVALPGHWRCVRGLDGFVTYRTELAGQAPAWLGGTAAPATRAAALLAEFRPAGNNVALPALAAGAELRQLLDSLPSWHAVYVFEDDMTVLAAVLRTLPLAGDIAAGRCILVPPERPEEFLRQYLADHPGLMPPGALLAMPNVPTERIGALRTLCEQVATACLVDRQQRLSVTVTGPRRLSPGGQPQFALLALTPDESARRAAEGLALAAKELGWPVLYRRLDDPGDVHPLAHAEALAEFGPNLLVCVGCCPGWLKPLEGGRVCHWVLSVAEAERTAHVPGFLRLAASPAVADALRAAVPAEDVVEWYWGCLSLPEPPQAQPDTILLVADLPIDDPASCGIDQPTHQQLWHYLRRLAARLWDTGSILRPAALLSQAEQDTGIAVGDEDARRLLKHAVQTVLIPRAVLQRVLDALESESVRVLAVGRGWAAPGGTAREDDPLAPRVDSLACDVLACVGGGSFLRPLAAIFTNACDPLSQDLVQAGACGWPLVLHGPDPAVLRRRLGGVLVPERDCLIFAGAKELRAIVRRLRQDPPAGCRRADQVARYLTENHSYRRRLRELVELLTSSGPWTADGSAQNATGGSTRNP